MQEEEFEKLQKKMKNLHCHFLKTNYEFTLKNVNDQVVRENERLNQIKKDISYSRDYLNK